MTSVSIHQGKIISLNICELNYRASKYMKQKPVQLQEEIDNSKFIAGDFSTPLNY